MNENYHTSLYVAHTPYHVLISCSLANSFDRNKEKHLIIISDYPNSDLYCEIIRKWKQNPFYDIQVFPGVYYSKNKLTRIAVLKRNERLLLYFSKSILEKGSKTFIFNDARVEGQLCSFINSQKGGINYYVEDGSAAYNSQKMPRLNVVEKTILKLLFPTYYTYISILGTYQYVNKILLFYPQMARKELQKKSSIKLSKEIFNVFDVAFTNKLLDSHGICGDDLKLYECIFVIPHSEFAKKIGLTHFIDLYSSIEDLIIKHFDNVAIKFHPRENNVYFVSSLSHTGTKMIPQSIPLEILWLTLLNTPPKIIVGDVSTSLLTCNTILEARSQILSTIKMLNLETEINMMSIFDSFGVKMPNSISELESIIKGEGIF